MLRSYEEVDAFLVVSITGGGLIENVPRMLGDSLQAVIDPSRWTQLPVFDYFRVLGGLTKEDIKRIISMMLM